MKEELRIYIPRKEREEFAADLTPDVTGGERTRMHTHRAGSGGTAKKTNRNVDVEWGPTVRGHDFRVN